MSGGAGVGAEGFDAFLSYRRSDGASAVRRIRQSLQSYRPPRALRARSSGRLRVYLDTAYERATNDFFEGVLHPALLSSRHLVVVVTPDAGDRGEGVEDWMRREIEAFERGPSAGNIVAVRAAGSDAVPLPPALARRYPNVEVVDLRGLSPLAFLNPARAARLADERIKLVGPMLGFGASDMPALRREEERRQQARLGSAVGLGTAVLVAVGGLSIFALRSSNRATEALTRSLFSADRVVQAVSASMAPGEVRSQLLTTGCDLLDSLRPGAGREPGAGALVSCAAERAARRDELGERAQADALLGQVEAEVSRRYAASSRVDDGLSLIELLRVGLERAGAPGSGLDVRAAGRVFLARATSIAEASPTGSTLAREAANALQVAAVRFAEAHRLEAALAAVEASLATRAVSKRRKPSAADALEAVASTMFKAKLQELAGRPDSAAIEVGNAARMLAEIPPAELDGESLRPRLATVRSMLSEAKTQRKGR